MVSPPRTDRTEHRLPSRRDDDKDERPDHGDDARRESADPPSQRTRGRPIRDPTEHLRGLPASTGERANPTDPYGSDTGFAGIGNTQMDSSPRWPATRSANLARAFMIATDAAVSLGVR
jgi:hypothetical protein